MTMKVVLDRTKCTGIGLCEAAAPDYFEVGDDGLLVVLRDDISDADLSQIESAILGCPTEALKLVDG
jgi:ferredoxin